MLQELNDPGSRGFKLDTANGIREAFLVRKANRVYGYVNKCPHTGANLDWVPDQFLDSTCSFIQCATHGALFGIVDGICFHGPCAGDRLRSIDLIIEQGCIYVSDANKLPPG
jgi:nitrite reductase/ring-hydroxylating ferredoxin subunit